MVVYFIMITFKKIYYLLYTMLFSENIELNIKSSFIIKKEN